MEKEKLSLLNDEFDLSLALLIIRKNLLLIFLFLVFGFAAAFFINRYSTRKYTSNSIVKIGDKNEVNRVMNFQNIYETNLNGELSRLNSKKMLSDALNPLELKINYYTKGKFLNSENYSSSPFKIKFQLKDKSILNNDFSVRFTNGLVSIKRTMLDSVLTITCPANKWISLNGLELKVVISNQTLNALNNKENSYLFNLTDESSLVNAYSNGLNIKIHNSAAKTINISFTGNHPKKCADIVNSLAAEFLKSNMTKKKESANKMIEFTDDQILKINKKLDYYQRLIKPYKELEDGPNSLDLDFGKLTNDLKKSDKLEEFELEKSLSDFSKFQNALHNEIGNESLYSMLLLYSQNKYISSVGNKLKALLSERRSLIFRLTEEAYQVKEIDFQIKLEKDDLKEIISNLVGELERNVITVKERLSSYKISQKKAGANFDHNTDYLHLQRMYDINSEYYSKLLTKKAEYEMVRAGFVSDKLSEDIF